MRLAFSWLTVLPVRVARVDTAAARVAIMLAPLVGLALGALATGALLGAGELGLPPLLAGLLVVGLLALLTRGMHLDGLADTADGFGCYGPPQRALEVMRDGSSGPFAVITLIIVIGAQATTLAIMLQSGRWSVVPLALVAGRAAFVLCCVRGIPAARPDGLGALVAGTQPAAVAAAWWLTLAAAATLAVPHHWWLGPLAVTLAAAATLILLRHARRRLGGLTGDILGAANEITTTVVLLVCSVNSSALP